MAWNEPGNSPKNSKNNQNDPWKSGPQRGKDQGPPDLDEALRKLQNKLNQLLGSKGNGGRTSGGSNQKGPSFSGAGIVIIALILIAIYVFAGFFIVSPAERAVIFRFGKFTGEVVGDGLHWIPPVIETKTTVNVDQVKTLRHHSYMLTRDENIVSVELAVQYRVGNIENYLFNVKNPENTLQQAVDSATREVIGNSTLDDVLTKKRDEIRQRIKAQIERILELYKPGIFITDVTMQPAKAPEQVKEAFDDAIKAQEDEQRSINRARAYQEHHIPTAEGQAQRIVEEAQAYNHDVIAQAQGETSRFLALLPEYKSHPDITRERLYLDTLQGVLGNSRTVFVDVKNGNNMFYIPLDKLVGSSANTQANKTGEVAHPSPKQQTTNESRTRVPENTNVRERSSYSR